MNKKFSVTLFVALAIFLISNFFVLKQSTAQSSNFAHVVPFTSPSGFLGFFDQNSGKIYMYDQQTKPAIIISQIDKLGEPLINILVVPNKKGRL